MSKNSQVKAVYKYLEEGHSITSFEAFTLFRITRLSAVIYLLKKQGHKIHTVQRVSVNSYGNSVHFAEYSLVKEVTDSVQSS